MTLSSQIDEIFDAISYSKGACAIRMLVNYLGLVTSYIPPSLFRSCVVLFLSMPSPLLSPFLPHSLSLFLSLVFPLFTVSSHTRLLVDRFLVTILTGEEDFKVGLRAYLEKFKYSNATTADLWASLA